MAVVCQIVSKHSRFCSITDPRSLPLWTTKMLQFFQKGGAQSKQSTQPQGTYFTRDLIDGRITLTQNGTETDRISDSANKTSIKEMKQHMYEYEGKPRKWDTLSPEQIAADFEEISRNFAHTNIKSCICAGLGSFNTSPRARLQLAAFETILEILRQRFEIEDIVFQDPAMDKLDKAFLRERGYTVVQHPEAQNAMTSTTFLYCPCISWEAVWEFLIVDHPALYYGPRFQDFDSMLSEEYDPILVLYSDEHQRNQDFWKFREGRMSRILLLAEGDKDFMNEFVWRN
ncbi:MAG: hypothetical protein Q9225_004118 [Loekoesia sp. 1 TL-2023]